MVSVTAIIVGGGDGFARKYAGINFKNFNTQSVLAQTGVLGKNLEFQQDNSGEYTLKLNPIELDGEVLGVGEKYAAAVVPPLEGDSPFWYRTSVGGDREAQGYPIKRSYAEENSSLEMEALPGMVDCSVVPNAENGFEVFFEDVAYETTVGFDDPELGQGRRDAICETLQEFELMLNLDEDGLKPGIVVQSSEDKTPLYSLSVVAPQYVGGSGFVSTLLADYLRTGVRRSQTSFTNDVSVLGINSGFVRYNFDDVEWSVDTGNLEDYDLKTVTRQNMLRLLGFGSFVGHQQENILSSSWKRWTEWDRLLAKEDATPIVNSLEYAFYNSSYNPDNFNPGNADEYDGSLLGGLVILGDSIPDIGQLENIAYNLPQVFTQPDKFQKGQSVSGLADENAVSHPILRAGEVKPVTQAEKEVLCLLGLSVDGISGCGAPRSVVENKYIERENNKTVCVNLFDTTYNAFTENFELTSSITEVTQTVNVNDSSVFTMYNTSCENPDFDTDQEKADFDEQHKTTNFQEAVAFAWKPKALAEETRREYVRFQYQVKDSISGRFTDPGEIAIHKCVVTAQSNQLCNGDFEYSSAQSPIDFQISSLEDRKNNQNIDIIGCSSTTTPGWCGQGTPDVFSSEFGYTWHPYFIQNNPQAFEEIGDTENTDADGIKKYAGGVAGEILVQRLRLPLTQGITYSVTGKVLSTKNGQNPKIWYRTASDVRKQSDGSYHIDYPDVDATGEHSLITDGQPLVANQWRKFETTMTPENGDITHIAFGGTDNEGRLLFDDLSIQFVTECGECLSDGNGDCATNTGDLTALLTVFNSQCPGETVGCTFDLNFDGVVNTGDLTAMLSSFGSVCELEEANLVVDPASNIIVLSDDDDDVNSASLSINYEIMDRPQVVPNSQGFKSNLKVQVKNISSRDILDLNLIGMIPYEFEYFGHVATKENTAYQKSQNTVFVSELDENEDLELYFNIQLTPSICAEVERQQTSQYNTLVGLGLCDSFQLLLEKQYGIERDKEGNIKPSKGGGGGRTDDLPVEDEEGGPLPDPECSDGIDNDGDRYIDAGDPGCESSADDSEDTYVPQCSDGIDNDLDGKKDGLDPECTSGIDNDESVL